MPLSAGDLLNHRYQIVKLLSQGGFGRVYYAWDANLDGPVAIKESLETSPAAERQFQIEARLLFRIAHHNLPRVHDYFVIPQQGLYLVMDFIEGDDLEAILQQKRAPLPEAQVIEWVLQVCDALTHLHKQNPPIIHRDIKPGNIKITPPDSDHPHGKAVLVDFGIAKIFTPGDLTTQGARAVTPGYSPPEQYGHGATDVRSDIYALGATLYRLLTYSTPPESVSRLAQDSLPQPISLNPTLSPGIASAVLHAIQIDPNQRFSSVSAFAQALSHALTTPPQAFPPTQRISPRSGLSRTQKAGLLALAGLTGAVVIFFLSFFIISTLLKQSSATSPSAEPGALVVSQPSLPALSTTTLTETITPSASAITPAALYAAGETQNSPVDGAVMVFLPAGEFLMGSSDVEAGLQVDQLPKHRILLDAYWIDRSEVSNAMYQQCVDAGVCLPPVNSSSSTRKFYYANPDYATYPVIWISWENAAQYCAWAGRRLPSEAEWERAARGDTGSNEFPWGSQPPAGDIVNYCDVNCTYEWKDAAQDDGFADTSPVDFFIKGASQYGLLNMAGNVWEWVFDYYASNFYHVSPLENPFGPASGSERVLRGGSFENAARDLRTVNRFHFSQDAASSSFGFRCAQSVK